MEAKIRYARTSDGVNIAYAVYGSGPPLLIARPLLRPPIDSGLARLGDAIMPRLADSRSVVVWDGRGLGLSSATSKVDYTLETSARDLLAVADALELEQFDLMGQMTPAHTAIGVAARAPERVKRLVLWNPPEMAGVGASPRTTSLVDLPDIVESDFPSYVRLAALRLFGWEHAAVAQRWEQMTLEQFTSRSWLHLMEQMEQIDSLGEAASVRAPTLVLIDLDTTVLSLKVGRKLRQEAITRIAAALNDAELVTIRQGGPSYAEVTDAFLGGQELRSAGTAHGTAVILFADIVDSTAMTERLGDTAFREKSRELDTAMRGLIRDGGGTVIDAKTLGDGVLATFASGSQAIDAALQLEGAATTSGLQLHVGLHAGDVIREDGNVFGGAVNIAARISSMSAAGEVLVSATVRDLARTSAGVSFEDRGDQSLKGVAEPVRVFAVRWRA